VATTQKIIMAQKFSQIEGMVACWYLIAMVDGKTDKERDLIKDKLMKKYDLWSHINWEVFLEKWNNWVPEGYEKILNHCKKILDNSEYSTKVKVLAGMWSVALDADELPEGKWSDSESNYYIQMEKALNVNREDVKKEWRTI